MPVTTISSDDSISIESPFKIGAGPGAGKTHWLIQHIGNVLANSKRLGNYRKIACITYTNVAVDTIVGRLGSAKERVEVSTIHSFIYTNILRPYMHFIAGEYNFEVRYMDGHDDHIVSRATIKEWIDNHPNLAQLRHPFSRDQLLRRPENLEALGNWLSSIYYKFVPTALAMAIDNSAAANDDNTVRLGKANCLDKLVPGLMDYKMLFWKKGKLHHDDVLFFGYQLIVKYPFILTVLRAKFPYFFVDEFQDTSPIQTAIIKLLAQNETMIGVIGDKAQSIYSFQGAVAGDFDAFSVTGLQDYLIDGNRRSTTQIVDLLNHCRPGFPQRPLGNRAGLKPMLIVGDRNAAFAYSLSQCGGQKPVTLSRYNLTAQAMQRNYNSTIPAVNLLDSLFSIDTWERFKVIKACIAAVELARDKRFKEAIKEMEKNFYGEKQKTLRRKTAFGHLSMLLSKYATFSSQPLFDFYSIVKGSVRPDIPALATGRIKSFYESNTFQSISLFVGMDDEVLESRSIHKAKGDEFENVFVVLDNAADIKYLVSPDLTKEEHRVRYVAWSRAKDRLFVSVPAVDQAAINSLSSLFDIVQLTGS